MTAMTFSLSGGPELERRLKAAADPRKLLGAIIVRAVHEAQLEVPVRSGNLRRTIRIGTVTNTYGEITAGGTDAAGYAAAVEFGSRAHTIVPRKAKVLAWGGARTLGGKLRSGAKADHFARRVRHPGTRAHPYLRPGLGRALEAVGIDAIIDGWNGAA